MHDTLAYFQQDPVYRRYHHHELTFSLVYAFTENFMLPLSHDEVVHGKGSMLAKMPGDKWQKLANLRSLYAFMWAHPGKKLLFMGCEFAQEQEWSHERSLDWHLLEDPQHDGMRRLVSDLNRVYKDERALWDIDFEPSGFAWLEPNDAENNVVSFLRAVRERRAGARRRLQLLAGAAPQLPDGAAARRALARGDQHRRRRLRRLERGQLRRRGRGERAVARPAVLGRAPAPAAGRGLARAGVGRGSGPPEPARRDGRLRTARRSGARAP